MHFDFIYDLKNQLGASIHMLENAIDLCPDSHWSSNANIWYMSFHTLFFLDYYLSLDPVNFNPPPPFTDSEFQDTLPAKPYTKEQITQYLNHCKAKFETFFDYLNPDTAGHRWRNQSASMDYSFFEIALYNLRHVQHHTGQINLLLRQNTGNAPEWVFRLEE